MGVTIGAQTISVTAAVLLGLIAGLLYDLLRPLRRGARGRGVIADLIFSLFCMGAMFFLGMTLCGGRLGLWEPAGFLVSLSLYLFGVSPSVSPFFGICREKCADFLKKRAKK